MKSSECFYNNLQEKNNLEIDLNYKLKTLQERLDQEVNEHKVTKARLTDKHQSIEEAKSVAMCGKCCLLVSHKILYRFIPFFKIVIKASKPL